METIFQKTRNGKYYSITLSNLVSRGNSIVVYGGKKGGA